MRQKGLIKLVCVGKENHLRMWRYDDWDDGSGSDDFAPELRKAPPCGFEYWFPPGLHVSMFGKNWSTKPFWAGAIAGVKSRAIRTERFETHNVEVVAVWSWSGTWIPVEPVRSSAGLRFFGRIGNQERVHRRAERAAAQRLSKRLR